MHGQKLVVIPMVAVDSRNVAYLPYPSGMDVTRMISDLRQERDQIDEAIRGTGTSCAGHGKRRGRPPAMDVRAERTCPKDVAARQAARTRTETFLQPPDRHGAQPAALAKQIEKITV